MAPTDAGRAMTTDRTAIPIGVTGSVWSMPATAELTSNTAPSMKAAIGRSVSGGCNGLPDQPRSPLNARPFIVSVGRTENFLTTSPHHLTAADR